MEWYSDKIDKHKCIEEGMHRTHVYVVAPMSSPNASGLTGIGMARGEQSKYTAWL